MAGVGGGGRDDDDINRSRKQGLIFRLQWEHFPDEEQEGWEKEGQVLP